MATFTERDKSFGRLPDRRQMMALYSCLPFGFSRAPAAGEIAWVPPMSGYVQ
jgi:hypothetical protein